MKYVFNWKKFNEEFDLGSSLGMIRHGGRDCIEIGSTPNEEDCVQAIGGDDYHFAMEEECNRYLQMLKAKFPNCDKVDLEVKWQGGEPQYAEVVAYYSSPEGEEQAIFIQDNVPDTWDDITPIRYKGYKDTEQDELSMEDPSVPMPNKSQGPEVYWKGSDPIKDDFDVRIIDTFVDGKTKQGPWAMMAPSSFQLYGVGLGLGKGQKYQKQGDGKWLKIEG
jgi:hypothetical protein